MLCAGKKMGVLAFIFFWSSFGLILYVYIVYPVVIVLSRLIFVRQGEEEGRREPLPYLSVLISAFNEEHSIAGRIKNILKNGYPFDKIEIIMASDGSTDGTVFRARELHDQRVVIQDHKRNRGRAAVQNDGIAVARGEIIVFTDAGTVFEAGCLMALAKPFSNSSIGCVVGNLIYSTVHNSVSISEGKYFSFEKKIRQAESGLGILATGTGACMAVRKKLWRKLSLIDDCDFSTPLDVILQNFRVVYEPSAIAYDYPPASIPGEIKVRIRQTSKNLVGTIKRWGLRGWVQHPIVSWGLLSHKILRWFTPFFLLGILISNLLLLREGAFYHLIFVSQLAFYLLAIVGLLGEKFNKKIPIASLIFSFCVANLGMAIGVVKGLVGKAPAAYSKTD